MMVSGKSVVVVSTLALVAWVLTPVGARAAGAKGANASPNASRSFTYGRVARAGAPSDMLCDQTSGACAFVSAYQYGPSDACGAHPSAGHWFLFAWAAEQDSTATGRLSSAQNFRLQASNGKTYSARAACGNDSGGRFLTSQSLTARSDSNAGWVEFQVPAREAVYALSWNESGQIQYQTLSHVHVAGAPAVVARRVLDRPGTTV